MHSVVINKDGLFLGGKLLVGLKSYEVKKICQEPDEIKIILSAEIKDCTKQSEICPKTLNYVETPVYKTEGDTRKTDRETL